MWDKNMVMDEKKKAEWTERLKDLGIPEDAIDEKLIWSVKKTSHKIEKLRFILDKKGIEEGQANLIARKVAAYGLEKDLTKIKQWHEMHKDDHKGDSCCQHCGKCHHEEEHTKE